MAKKKHRAFFICPRWSEVADAGTAPLRIHEKHLAAIQSGQPMARSTLRKVLLAARASRGVMFDVDAYIVDQRTVSSR